MQLALARLQPRWPVRAEPGKVALACHGVTVRHGAATALDGVDLEVRGGEVVALVGPNGAGKSTLVAVLAGDQRPSQGGVEIAGAALDEWTTVELAVRRAVLLQQTELSFPFTVLDVVRMGRAPWGGAGEDRGVDDDEVVARAMSRTDVSQFASRVYTSLSGGERARAALARVLAQDADVLLLDEPTAALDIRHQEQVLGVAREEAAAGRAVVVVMHDLGLAAAHSDRVVVLSRGVVRAQGAPGEVLTAELLSEVYETPIELVENPRNGQVLVVPLR